MFSNVSVSRKLSCSQISTTFHKREVIDDTRRTNHEDEESDHSGYQGNGGSVWIDGTGCCSGNPGIEDVDARVVGSETVRGDRATDRQPVTAIDDSRHRGEIVSEGE